MDRSRPPALADTCPTSGGRGEPPDASEILSLHVFYRGDLDHLFLDGLLQPLLDVAAEGRMHFFFLLRYQLGGPHLRLRVAAPPREHEALYQNLGGAAEHFFRLHPAAGGVSDEEIRRHNREIVARDKNESSEAIYPSPSFRSIPFVAELERYGGAAHLDHSLWLFALATYAAVDRLASWRGLPKPRRLVAAMAQLLSLAWSLAPDEGAFCSLLGYAAAPPGDSTAVLEARARSVFERRPEGYAKMAAEVLEDLTVERAREPESAIGWLWRGARSLDSSLTALPVDRRLEIAKSHLHLYANRLGLSVPEEIYVNALLRQATGHLQDRRPELWGRLMNQLPGFVEGAVQRPPAELLAPALATLTRTLSGPGTASSASS